MEKSKHIKIIVIIAVPTIIIAAVISCVLYRNHLTKTNKDNIVGEWKSGFGDTYKFDSDGSFTKEWYDPDGESDYSSHCKGLYKISGNTLILHIVNCVIDDFSYANGSGSAGLLSEQISKGEFDLRCKYKIDLSKRILNMYGIDIDAYYMLIRIS